MSLNVSTVVHVSYRAFLKVLEQLMGDVGAGHPFSRNRWVGGTASNLGCKEPYITVYIGC